MTGPAWQYWSAWPGREEFEKAHRNVTARNLGAAWDDRVQAMLIPVDRRLVARNELSRLDLSWDTSPEYGHGRLITSCYEEIHATDEGWSYVHRWQHLDLN